MRLLCWNVNGRVGEAARRQVQAVLSRSPDVIALQELTGNPRRRGSGNYPSWVEELTAAGYSIVSAVDLLAVPYPEPDYDTPPLPLSWKRPHGQIKRTHFNLVASRHPIAPLPGLAFDDPEEARLAFPEKHISARIRIDGHEIDIHNTHLPPGVSKGVLKVHHFEAVRRRVDRDPDRPTVLCGDFNAPAEEDEQGPVINYGGDWDAEITERWVKAESGALENSRLRDVYRDVHTDGSPFPASLHTGQKRNPRRYDYIFASREFTTSCCKYHTDWLEKRWSDHAAVEADFALATEASDSNP